MSHIYDPPDNVKEFIEECAICNRILNVLIEYWLGDADSTFTETTFLSSYRSYFPRYGIHVVDIRSNLFNYEFDRYWSHFDGEAVVVRSELSPVVHVSTDGQLEIVNYEMVEDWRDGLE